MFGDQCLLDATENELTPGERREQSPDARISSEEKVNS